MQATSILLKSEVRIWGGYPGWNGTTFDNTTRDPVLHLTVLSGDLSGDDIPGNFTANRSDNANSVVRVPANCLAPNGGQPGENGANLDGFTIRGGHAVHEGGGIWIEIPNGVDGITAPVIRDCIITDNYAGSYGAGVFGDSEVQATFRKCKFIGNKSDGSGGAIGMEAGTTLTILDCTIDSNIARAQGGGIVADRGTNLSAQVCTFQNNIVTGFSSTPGLGGALYVLGYAGSLDPTYIHIANCLFNGNQAQNNGVGGALYVETLGAPFGMENCTVADNSATGVASVGGGLYIENAGGSGGSANIVNCIFWNDTANNYPEIRVASGTLNKSYSDIEGNGTSGTNIDVDPDFVNPSAGNFRLGSCYSLCVNAGDNGSAPADSEDVNENSNTSEKIDLDKGPRILSTTVDMGAYERGSEAPCAADTNHDGQVSVPDLLNVINDWSPGPQTHNGNVAPVSGCSVTGTTVDVVDLLAVINAWGAVPLYCGSSTGALNNGPTFPTSISDCFNVFCVGLSGQDWEDCINKCVEAVCQNNPSECE